MSSPQSSPDSDSDTEGGVADSAPIGALLAERRREAASKGQSQVERDMAAAGIQAVFDPVKPMSSPIGAGGASGSGPAARVDFSDMRSFLLSPVPKGAVFQCYILRNKKGLKNKIYPTYEAYASGEERFLLAARKRTKNKTSNYMISMDKNNVDGSSAKESASYLGKVRSNFVGSVQTSTLR